MESKPISEIKPYPKNAKRHPKKQVEQIANSIREFGFNQPIVVDKEGVVVVGHGRLEAARLLGLEEVPTVQVDLTEEQAKAYRLADNKLNESEWDMDVVIEELKLLSIEQVKLTGFDLDLLADPVEDDFDEEEALAGITEPQSKVGDLYQLGEHRLLVGDSTKAEDVQLLMDGQLAQLIFTDPPYNVDYDYTRKYKGVHGARKKELAQFDDKKSSEDFSKFLLDVLTLGYKHSTEDMSIYVCHATKTQLEFWTAFKEAGFHFSQTIIWLKERIILALGQDYHRVYEPILFGWKKGNKHYKNKKITTEKEVWDLDKVDFEERLDVWYLHRDKSKDYIHPTQKPVRLPERAIKKNSRQGDILYEPFNGSGSTMMACEQLGRRCFAMELDPRYIDVALKRYEQFTGKKPEKIN